ncbi:MAG: TRAP transporter small permease subunit [Gammaproteobacteria bacterium]|nr:TRAP transporter small permease subunit [Gammaproteobacteria bacterium]MDD9799780.1 TRAP transporter small permease subunit [Gammaproteobacteria bacterium]MDD9816200.1 TRAP transporter small permease subunit [Gammaproteobacteria bacterium]MDD9851423.1 TRAP transporter small permease subunit [Gammaproteobacteria bacterium]MDD9871652.1 TRAP transporter small permease subunit [Gammaproteobacteria bacterium]
MNKTLAFLARVDRTLVRIGQVAAWAGVALITVTIFDVITRRFLVLGSTKLQELEWHFHVILFGFCLAFAYLKDAHVRIDLVRERLPQRVRWWIEAAGCIFFLLPYCALVVWFSVDFVTKSFLQNEISASATGLSHRWLIKSVIPLSFTMLGIAGLVVLARKIIQLFGPPEAAAAVTEAERAGQTGYSGSVT